MCETTYRRHVSTECATGGSAQCDGYCEPHGDFCDCSCHEAADLPETVEGVLKWHDAANGVLARETDYESARLIASEYASGERFHPVAGLRFPVRETTTDEFIVTSEGA